MPLTTAGSRPRRSQSATIASAPSTPAVAGVEDDRRQVEVDAVEDAGEQVGVDDVGAAQVQEQPGGATLELAEGDPIAEVVDHLAHFPAAGPGAGSGAAADERREAGQTRVADGVGRGVERLDRQPVERRRAKAVDVADERFPGRHVGSRELAGERDARVGFEQARGRASTASLRSGRRGGRRRRADRRVDPM